MTQSHHDDQPTLRDYLRVVLLHKRIVIAVVVLVTLAAGVYSFSKPKLYDATARLMYSPPTNVADPSAATDVSSLTLQLQSVGNTLTSPKVQGRVSQLVSGDTKDVDYSVQANVVTSGSSTSSSGAIADSVDITVRSTSADASAALANAYATAVIAQRKDSQKESYQVAQKVVQQQLDLLDASGSRASAEYAALSMQLRNLQIAEETANGDFVIIQPATAPSAPASPKPVKTAILGFLAGSFLGIALAFVVGQFDTRVRNHRQASDILGYPVIGRIPRMARQASDERSLVALSDPDGVVSESLRVLRRNLEWSRIDGRLRSLVFTSCLKGEGKTVTLCNLAVTLARAGNNVVVVDADLRNPQVHRAFDIRNAVGLTSVVVGATSLEDALVSFKPAGRPAAAVRTSSGAVPAERARSSEGSLLILPSGPLPPNPGEVVASHSAAAIIEKLAASEADYVLVDTPPLLAFGDAGALAPSIDGLVMLVNITKAKRPALEDGREILDSLPCRVVGLVVVGEPRDEQRYSTYSNYSPGSGAS
jgi:Mrp family chromosome partitioning ATPase/capsular polysaccharide biosynthesis protein